MLKLGFQKNTKFLLILAFLTAIIVIGLYLVAKYHLWLWLILISYLLNFIIAFFIVQTKKELNTKLSWIFALLVIPVFGSIGYLLFGRDYKISFQKYLAFKQKYLKLEQWQDSQIFYAKEKNPVYLHQFRFAMNLIARPVYNNNELKLFFNTSDYFISVLKDLKTAQQYIHIAIFALSDGITLDALSGVLSECVKRGVKIRLLYDGVGSYSLFSFKYRQKFLKLGIEIKEFIPPLQYAFSPKLNYRMHKKIIIIDGKISYFGGSNFGSQYINLDPYLGLWRDTNIRVVGASTRTLALNFLEDWELVTGVNLLTEPTLTTFVTKSNIHNTNALQIIENDPLQHPSPHLCLFLHFISTAKTRIWLISPYFVAGQEIQLALQNAALAGVDVRIILPEWSDKKGVSLYGRSLYANLTKANIHVYEYSNAYVHAKTYIFDETVLIGSPNLDYRSIFQSYELLAIFYSVEIAKAVAEQFLLDLTHAHQPLQYPNNKTFLAKHPFWTQIKIMVLRLFSPLF